MSLFLASMDVLNYSNIGLIFFYCIKVDVALLVF